MVVREKLYTAEEFWEFTQLPENEGLRFELEDGAIIEMASSSQQNTVTAARIIYFLSGYVLPNNLGYVTAPDGGFKLASGHVRQPDAAFISKARQPRLEGTQFKIAPDLAVEVVSPDEDIFKKAREYLHAGTKRVWAVYADEQTVYVFRLGEDGTLHSKPHGIEDILDGEDALPGFTLPVSEIFPT